MPPRLSLATTDNVFRWCYHKIIRNSFVCWYRFYCLRCRITAKIRAVRRGAAVQKYAVWNRCCEFDGRSFRTEFHCTTAVIPQTGKQNKLLFRYLRGNRKDEKTRCRFYRRKGIWLADTFSPTKRFLSYIYRFTLPKERLRFQLGFIALAQEALFNYFYSKPSTQFIFYPLVHFSVLSRCGNVRLKHKNKLSSLRRRQFSIL